MNTISPRRRYKGLQVGIGLGAFMAVACFITTCAVYGFSGPKDFSMALICGVGTLVVCAATWELWLTASTADPQPDATHDHREGRVFDPGVSERSADDDFDWYFAGYDPVATVPARGR